MRTRIAALVALGLFLGVGMAMAQLPGSPGPSGAFSPSPIFQVPDIISSGPGAGTADGTKIQLVLPKPVVTGVVVLLEDQALGNVVTNWSDVLIYSFDTVNGPPVSPANNAIYITYISDSPSGPGYITQTDLNRAGLASLTIAGIQAASNTTYIREWSPAHTAYAASGNIYQTESSDHDVPGIGMVGLALLSVLLATTGMVFVMRRRAAGGRIA